MASPKPTRLHSVGPLAATFALLRAAAERSRAEAASLSEGDDVEVALGRRDTADDADDESAGMVTWLPTLDEGLGRDRARGRTEGGRIVPPR